MASTGDQNKHFHPYTTGTDLETAEPDDRFVSIKIEVGRFKGSWAQVWCYSVSFACLTIRYYFPKVKDELLVFLYPCDQVEFEPEWEDSHLTLEYNEDSGLFLATDSKLFVRCSGLGIKRLPSPADY